MASLDALASELLFMIGDYIGTFDDPPDRERAFAALALTNRRFYLMFNTALYKHDARNKRKAMAWGAFFGSVATMKKSRAAGAHADQEADRHPAVLRLLGPFRPHRLPSVLAAAGGRNDVLEWLLQQEIPVNKRTGVQPEYGITREIVLPTSLWSSMYWAILYNHEHTVRYLLGRRVGPMLTAKGGVTAMHAAAAMGRDAMFDLLLSLPGCGLDARDEAGNTPLHYAARGFFDVDRAVSSGKSHGCIAKASSIANLVYRGADLQATNRKGESPLVFALTMHHPQWKAALQLLDLQPVGFGPSDRLIATTLACASEEPKTEETAFLGRVLTPATLNRPYRVPGTPLNIGFFRSWHSHAGKSTMPLMWYIVQRCSVSSARGGYAHAMEGMFVELLNRGARPGGKDSRDRTPLHACVFAAMTGSYPHTFDPIKGVCIIGGKWPETRTQFPFNFISRLLSRGASLDARDHKGLTPLEYALEKTSTNATKAAKIEALARNVVRLVLLLVCSASGGFASPTEDVKRRLVGKLGVEILAPDDPLKARLGRRN